MTLHIYPQLEQRSEAWFDQRRGLVTASVVGQLITTRRLTAIDYDCPKCGASAKDPCVSLRVNTTQLKTMHPERAEHAKRQPSPLIIEPASNDTSRDLTALLVAERITGWTDPTWVSADMEMGRECEPIARAKYAEHYAPVTEVGLMVLEERGFRLGFSPDGLVGEVGLLEIKSRRQKNHLKTILADGIPIEHMAQCQTGLLVSGRKWLDYVSFCGGMKLLVRRVYPQRNWFDAIIAAVRKFEENAAEMQRLHDELTVGLYPTERIIEQEIVL